MSDKEETEEVKQPNKLALLDGTDFTQEQFSAQTAALIEKARAAGLRPLRVMVGAYLQQGINVFDKLLEGLEPPVDTPKKKE